MKFSYSLDSEIISCQAGVINLEHKTGIVRGGVEDLQPNRNAGYYIESVKSVSYCDNYGFVNTDGHSLGYSTIFCSNVLVCLDKTYRGVKSVLQFMG